MANKKPAESEREVAAAIEELSRVFKFTRLPHSFSMATQAA
jgi:hypothetical protein